MVGDTGASEFGTTTVLDKEEKDDGLESFLEPLFVFCLALGLSDPRKPSALPPAWLLTLRPCNASAALSWTAADV